MRTSPRPRSRPGRRARGARFTFPNPRAAADGIGLVVTVVGKNRPGVLAEVTAALGAARCDVRDISQRIGRRLLPRHPDGRHRPAAATSRPSRTRLQCLGGEQRLRRRASCTSASSASCTASETAPMSVHRLRDPRDGADVRTRDARHPHDDARHQPAGLRRPGPRVGLREGLHQDRPPWPKDLVEVAGVGIEPTSACPIINKRIAVTPIALVAAASARSPT